MITFYQFLALHNKSELSLPRTVSHEFSRLQHPVLWLRSLCSAWTQHEGGSRYLLQNNFSHIQYNEFVENMIPNYRL